MKHTACGGWWEIRTDPASATYIVVDGAKKRDYGEGLEGKEAEGDLKFLSEEEREKRRVDAFAGFEGRVEEKGIVEGNKERVEELYEKAEVWRDPYEVNARLRKGFRVQRKVLKKEERYKEGMQEKYSLGMDIADETEGDRVRARLVEFGAANAGDGLEEQVWKPLFAEKKEMKAVEPVLKTKKLKSEVAAERSRASLQQTLVGNTRASIDPFRSKETFTPSRVTLGLLKRKRDISPVNISKSGTPLAKEGTPPTTPAKKPAPSLTLVGYDSD